MVWGENSSGKIRRQGSRRKDERKPNAVKIEQSGTTCFWIYDQLFWMEDRWKQRDLIGKNRKQGGKGKVKERKAE